jgi:SET domain-containing protein
MVSSRDLRLNSDFEVRKSSIDGLGLYALRDFLAGEIVLRWNISQLIPKNELISLPEEEGKYTHPFDAERILIVQPPERYVNHSCDNNTEVRNFCDVAIRNITAGEEITGDYSTDESGSKFNCRCGAENCRGQVG